MGEVPELLNNLQVSDDTEDVVNPWEVSSSSQKGVDYDKLISTLLIIQILFY